MKICLKCGIEHDKQGLYCSRSCANSRIWNEEDKLKKSNSAKNSEKVKEKALLRKGKSGTRKTEEQKVKISKSLKEKGLIPWNKGKRWSEEKRKEFSDIKKEYYKANPENTLIDYVQELKKVILNKC